MLSLILIFLALVAVTVTVSIFTDKQSNKKALRKPHLTWAYAFIASIYFFICNIMAIAFPLLIFSLWMAIKANGLNIAGIKFLLKSLPYSFINNHAKIISICDEALNGDTRAPALFAMGVESATFMNQFEKSLAFSNRLVLLTSSEPRGYFLRGIAQYQMGNFEQSLRDINQAISLEAKQSAAYRFERARTKFALQDYSGALEDLNTFASSSFCKKEFKSAVETLHSDCMLAIKDKSD